jgi:hypothetical protein
MTAREKAVVIDTVNGRHASRSLVQVVEKILE